MLNPGIKNNKIISTSFLMLQYHTTPPFFVRTATYASGYKSKLCYCDYPQIWYCREGAYVHETEYGVYHCTPGTVLIIPPGVLQCYEIPEGGHAVLSRLCIAFNTFSDVSFASEPASIAALFLPPFFRGIGIPRSEVYELSKPSQHVLEEALSLLSLNTEKEKDKYAQIARIVSLPELALSDAQKEKAAELARTKLYPVMRALSYMNDNSAQKITAEQLCEVASVRRTTFFTLMKQYLGISYAAYLTMLRIFRANIALVQTDYPLSYISDMCGFANSSHMSKYYKKYKGILPKEDRAMQKKYQNQYGKLRITHDYFFD